MTVYPKAAMSKEEFGEILAHYIQKSRGIEVEHTFNVNLVDEGGNVQQTFDTDDTFGLVCAVGAVIKKFEPAILKQYEGVDEYGLDIYEKQTGRLFLQIDRNIHERGVKDVRFNIDIFEEFGYPVVMLDMVHNCIVHFYD